MGPSLAGGHSGASRVLGRRRLCALARRAAADRPRLSDSYLVDSASSHMLVYPPGEGTTRRGRSNPRRGPGSAPQNGGTPGCKRVKLEGAKRAPGHGGDAPAHRGTANDDHPIAPTESPSGTGPHAEDPAGGTPSRAPAGCGIRPSGGGSGPRGQRRRTADPTGRLPPGI